MSMTVMPFALKLDQGKAEEAVGLLTGKQKKLLVEGEFRLLPGDQFPIIAATNIPGLGIATVKSSEIHILPADAAHDQQAFFARRGRRDPKTVMAFTKIEIGSAEIIPMSLDAVVYKRYLNGELQDQEE